MRPKLIIVVKIIHFIGNFVALFLKATGFFKKSW